MWQGTLTQLLDAGTPGKCEKPRYRLAFDPMIRCLCQSGQLGLCCIRTTASPWTTQKTMIIPWLCYLSIPDNQERFHHNLWDPGQWRVTVPSSASDCFWPKASGSPAQKWSRSLPFHSIWSILLTRIDYVALWTGAKKFNPTALVRSLLTITKYMRFG